MRKSRDLGGLLGKGGKLSINQKDLKDWRVNTQEKRVLGREHSIHKGLEQGRVWDV